MAETSLGIAGQGKSKKIAVKKLLKLGDNAGWLRSGPRNEHHVIYTEAFGTHLNNVLPSMWYNSL